LVTLSDGENYQVKVNTESNRMYSADLSTLMSGTITSALLVVGVIVSASVSPVVLDSESVTNATLAVNETADHGINGTEQTAGSFMVSDLPHGETGTVTFSDNSNRQVVVGVSKDGAYSTNLSALTDRIIKSSLLATDPAGSSATATGNPALLDTDSALTPSLSFDTTNPAHVTFAVSETGTVTFNDASGRQHVVAIGSKGALSANLSNLSQGIITHLLLVRDLAGNVVTVDPPLNLGDGSANAPAGTPQLPTLLSSYVVRPSWNVAGVDYAVGIPAGTVLKDPTTINMAGCVVNAAAHQVHITGNNVTLSGYDFSGGGGWTVYVDSGTNATIENSKFLVGSNHQDPIFVSAPASNVSILNNVIDGAGLLNYHIGQGLIEGDGLGNVTIEYNLIKNAYSENIVWGNNTVGATQNIVIQFNLIQNAGLGGNQGAHGDWIQLVNSPGANTNSVQINYNTWMQTVPYAQGHTQGLSLYSANNGSDAGGVQTEAVKNNTFVVTPGRPNGAYVNYAIIMDTSRLIGTGAIENNYFDPTGIGWYPGYGGNWDYVGNGNGSTGGPYSGAVTSSNNVNMLNGAYYPQNVFRSRPQKIP
jgi:hypothetical protein